MMEFQLTFLGNDNISISKTNLETIKNYNNYSDLDKYILSNKFIGKSNFYSSGLTIAIDTSNKSDITAVTLLQIINDLNCAGADGISINNQRIVNMSDIMDISAEYILVNSICVSSPYIINVAGNSSDLINELSLENSTISKLQRKGYTVQIYTNKFVNLNAYSPKRAQDKLNINYMYINN